jgi:hypothetical protein|tara:strand:- start:1262 stop:1495 length:234 start_codon:yes stop_codon:yes gene_type:complete
MSKGYEQFKKVDAELDKLLLYLEKLEEDYAKAISDVDENFKQYKRYQKGYNILSTYFDYLPDDEKEEVDKKLMKLNL